MFNSLQTGFNKFYQIFFIIQFKGTVLRGKFKTYLWRDKLVH